MYKKIIFVLMIITCMSSPLLAAEIQNIELRNSDTPYSLTADGGISYDNTNGVLVASDNARFESDDIILLADEISVFYEEHIIQAVGQKLRIQVGEQIYKGTSLDFNYQTLTGSIYGVSSKVNNLFVSGETITLNKSNMLNIDQVELTPCILPDPHYSIKAKKVVVYPEDRIVAKGVWFYFNGYRIFYLPAYTVKVNQTIGSFERVSLATSFGYNSSDGIYLELDYPYELTDRLTGNISGELNQHSEKYFEMENYYQLHPNLDIINYYHYQEEEDDDGRIEETNELSGGLHYRIKGLDIYSIFKHDYVNDKDILEFDTRYKYQKYDFRYFKKFTESKLSNELYSIKYNNISPITLLYKQGYDIDYLPYLSIEQLKYKYSGFNIHSSMGIGKVANKGIGSDKAHLDLEINKKFLINKKLEFNLYTQLESEYYISDDNGNSLEENYYNYYLIGFNTQMSSDLNEKLTIDYNLGYNYSWDSGKAYLPSDKNDVKESINPALGITYHLSEHESLNFEIEGSYELKNRELEDLNVKLTKQLDCYSYYVGYDVLDKSFELGINF